MKIIRILHLKSWKLLVHVVIHFYHHNRSVTAECSGSDEDEFRSDGKESP